MAETDPDQLVIESPMQSFLSFVGGLTVLTAVVALGLAMVLALVANRCARL